MDDRQRHLIRKTEGEAQKVRADPEAGQELADSAQSKLDGLAEKLTSFAEQISLFIGLVRDYCCGVYRQVPWKLILSATAALIWFVNPFDLIPDFITGIGLVDDAIVAGLVVGSFRRELETYREWKKSFTEAENHELPDPG